jgi:hypothetical protein
MDVVTSVYVDPTRINYRINYSRIRRLSIQTVSVDFQFRQLSFCHRHISPFGPVKLSFCHPESRLETLSSKLKRTSRLTGDVSLTLQHVIHK